MGDERALEKLEFSARRSRTSSTVTRPTIDAKDYVGLRSTFHDDAIGQYGDAPEMHGADVIVKWIEEMCVDQGFQHHLINVYHVDLDLDAGEATASTYHTSHQIRRDDPDRVLLIVGRYRDKVRRVEGEWKILDKRMEVGWVEQRHHPQSEAAEHETELNLAAQERSGVSQ